MGCKTRPVVTISEGQLMGMKATTASGTPYYAFKGIPFAKPPVGDLRFKAPEPAESWDGVRDATYERNVSYQPRLMQGSLISSWDDLCIVLRSIPTIYRFVSGFGKQSEDCLYLNVFTPKLPSSENETINLPVLFWIHGGGFIGGSGIECFGKMDNMMDRGVLVVSVNYRLGPFGFLSLDIPSAPGNAGMKDQVQALLWVQRNVSKFGGDPNRVTVYGISAGGASTHLLTVSPKAKGLFHGAIAGSGVGLCDWSVNRDHVKHATEFAKLLGIQGGTAEEIALSLKKVSAEDIMKAFTNYGITRKDRTLTYGLVFTPSLERPGPDAFLSELPEDILRDGRQAPVPFISGIVANEGTLWYMFPPTIDIFSLDDEREMFMPLDLYDALSEDQRKEVGNKIVHFYCGEKGICKETEAEFINIYGDINFVLKCLLTCRMHRATSPAPVYMYRFIFNGRFNGSRRILKGRPVEGPGHGDETGFVAPIQFFSRSRLGPDEPESQVTQKFSGLVANFVKTGKPTIPDKVNPDNTEWKPISEHSMSYLEMGSEFQMRHDKFGPRMQFWNDLYKKYLNKPILIENLDS